MFTMIKGARGYITKLYIERGIYAQFNIHCYFKRIAKIVNNCDNNTTFHL